jgi:hypothetical protein
VTLGALRDRFNDSLFPDPPAEDRSLHRGERLLLVGALLTIAVVLQLLRLGPASLDSIWAEDGPIFFQGALYEGFWEAIVSPYGGYLVLVPRLIGEAAALLPADAAAEAIAILSACVVAICGLAVWHGSTGHIRTPYLRLLLVAATVLSPVAGLEAIDSASYVVWYMLFATFWLLLWRPRTGLGAGLASGFVLATGLTTPGVWFFAPLAALRTIAARSRRDLAIVGAFWVAALAQIPVLVLDQEAVVEPVWSVDIWMVYLQRIVEGALLGLELGGSAWSEAGWTLLIALLVGWIAALGLGFKGATPPARLIVAIALPTSLVMFVVSLYQRAVATQMVWPEGIHFGDGGRYAIVPALLLISAALVLVDDRERRRSSAARPISWLGVGLAGVLALSIVTSFDQRDETIRGTPPWGEALRRAASECTGGIADVAVPTSPPGFGMQLPCDRISSSGVKQ